MTFQQITDHALRPLIYYFFRYDADKDGMLNHEEIKAFATGVFSVELNDEKVAGILRSLDPKKIGGIKMEKLQQLKVCASISIVEWILIVDCVFIGYGIPFSSREVNHLKHKIISRMASHHIL